MKNFIARGDVLEFTAGATIASGAGVLVGSVFGVATGDIANGAVGTINLTGIYELTKVDEQAWTLGAPVYWDAANNRATAVAASGLTLIGVAAAAVSSAAGQTLGRVRLNGDANARAAHVADASSGSAAEINAIRDALVAAGLMAPAS